MDNSWKFVFKKDETDAKLMASIKILGKDTAMYGISTVLARFLNYFIVPIQTYSIAARSGEYGTITNMYAYTGLVLLLLICGMESTFFYFANKDDSRSNDVFATAMTIVGTVTAVFLAVVYGGIGWIAPAMGYVEHPEYVLCMATVVAMDAMQTVPFARLRQERRGWVFVMYKLLFVVMSLLLNTLCYVLLPWLAGRFPDSLGRLYASHGVDASYAFYINIACTLLITVLMYKEFRPRGGRPDGALLRQMLSYTWPLMIVAVAGQMTQSFDKMFYNALSLEADSNVQLGIYGACAKIAMFMVVATQAYRMALEPLVYGNGKRGDKEDPTFLGNGTKLFLATLLVFFIGIMAWMDVLRYFVSSEYWEGLFVVPVVMAAEVCYAIFLNFSYWYKTDSSAGKANTLWGALFSITGCAIIVAGNVIFVPRYGYVACAWSSLASWATVMLFSYAVGAAKGRLHMPVWSMLLYVALAAVALAAVMALPAAWPSWLRIAVGTVITLAYAAFALWREGLVAALKKRLRRQG